MNTFSFTTIDEKHREIMQKMKEDEETTLPELFQRKSHLKKQMLAYKEQKEIDKYMNCLDELKSLEKEIIRIKREKKSYLLNNCSDLFHYFEDRKKVSAGINQQNTAKVNHFFKIKNTKNNANTEESVVVAAESDKDTDKESLNKSNYTRNYWRNINSDLFNIQDFMVPVGKCSECETGELVVHEEDGVMMCNQCFSISKYIMDSSKSTNKEIPNEVTYTAYIRLNHFKEILSQFQAKETTQIPPDVLEAIKNRIKKERKNVKDMNNKSMREILRRIKLNKYFEHIQYINSLLGVKPPIMSEKLIETLCVLFIEIQEPWALYCPESRTNFFNYTYALYQLCVLVDQKQYLPYIPMLKDENKQKEQDMIWKKICAHLDWAYFPTV